MKEARVKVALEVCVETLGDAHSACAAGADRLEICSVLAAGGVTPSIGLARAVSEATSLECVALVRPRAGDFLYTAHERSVMLRDIEALRDAGVAGVAIGALRPDGQLDSGALHDLLSAAGPMYGVLHRAFDATIDLDAALETAIELGFRRILTSGGEAAAPTGAGRIAEVVERSAGRIEILPGGGVRAANVQELVRTTNVRQVHSSAGAWQAGGMTFRNRKLVLGSDESAQAANWRVDSEELAALVRALRALA
jgi:copper homeostasis protein